LAVRESREWVALVVAELNRGRTLLQFRHWRRILRLWSTQVNESHRVGAASKG